MTRETRVPITPEVLRWAIEQSGLDLEAVATAAGVESELLNRWLTGRDRPTLTQARRTAAKLGRALAVLLLPAVPDMPLPDVKFRRLPGSDRRTLNPDERRALRQAVRVQRIVSWALAESGSEQPRIPRYSLDSNPESAANAVRRALAIPDEVRLAWRSPAQALAGWRTAMEERGVLVFLQSLGAGSCRGFSVWDDRAPLVLANTEWNPAARLFTILHELGHLITRTSSACMPSPTGPSPGASDATERWCEEFAAALLLPADEVQRFLEEEIGWVPGQTISDLKPVARLARRHNASLRATAIRLIKSRVAEPGIYAAIPARSDQKPSGGGGAPRRRYEVRRDQLGLRPVRVLVNAIGSGTLMTSDVLRYLDIGRSDLDSLAREIPVFGHT